MKSLKKQRMFTLIEMVMVIVIIAMLAALVGPNIYKKFAKASKASTKAQIKSIADAVFDYKLDTGKFIDSGVGLEELVRNVSGNQKWDGPYLNAQKLPKDAWGNEYIYVRPGQNGTQFDIISYGADGQPGGEGDAADITNWD